MNIFTHLGMAIKLKYFIESNCQIKLRTISFLMGSIKPDISSQYKNIPHCKNGSEDFIQKEIQSLFLTKIYKSEKCTRVFSERLGVLTHYFSDFFCYVHLDSYKGNMLEHYIYEMQQSVYYLKNPKTTSPCCYKEDIRSSHDTSSLCSYIDELYTEYLTVCNKLCHYFDIAFSIKACTALCFSIITECIADEETLPSITEAEAFS